MPISPVLDISESRPQEQKMVLLMPVDGYIYSYMLKEPH